MSFPRARSFNRICTEHRDDEVVMLVVDTLEYHLLSGKTYSVWLEANGNRSHHDLADVVFGSSSANHLLLVQLALDELAIAGLLENPVEDTRLIINRRDAAKLAAAAFLGGIGLPTVTSITAPSASAAFTFCGVKDNGEGCGPNDPVGCDSCCCCMWGASNGTCTDRSACSYYCLGDF